MKEFPYYDQWKTDPDFVHPDDADRVIGERMQEEYHKYLDSFLKPGTVLVAKKDTTLYDEDCEAGIVTPVAVPAGSQVTIHTNNEFVCWVNYQGKTLDMAFGGDDFDMLKPPQEGRQRSQVPTDTTQEIPF